MEEQAPAGIRQIRDAVGAPLSNAEVDRIWREVKANISVLDACPRHDFKPLDPDSPISDFKCIHCGGTVDMTKAHWYMKGLEHARQSK